MQTSEAVRVAVDILQAPSRVSFVRAGALPAGVGEVLRIAAGESEAIQQATSATGRTSERIVDAATFFIEQVMLVPEADSYRVLGGTTATPTAELRRNMALLMRWLHPDASNGQERSVFASRIAGAWDDLKTDDRRLAYDAQRVQQAPMTGKSPTPESRRRRRSNAARGPVRTKPVRRGLLASLLAFLTTPGRRR